MRGSKSIKIRSQFSARDIKFRWGRIVIFVFFEYKWRFETLVVFELLVSRWRESDIDKIETRGQESKSNSDNEIKK